MEQLDYRDSTVLLVLMEPQVLVVFKAKSEPQVLVVFKVKSEQQVLAVYKAT
jgi:hypothetical protein